MSEMSTAEYWEDRYASRPEEIFEWYQKYSNLENILTKYITNQESRILHVGAGSSRMSEDMYSKGFRNLVNIDFSPTVVKRMEDRYKSKGTKIDYRLMDVLEMKEFEDNEFDFVIDKGTLDCILCADDALPIAEQMLSEIDRVLSDKGIFFCISYGDEEHRLDIFKSKNWSIQCEKVVKNTSSIKSEVGEEIDIKSYHFVYILIKNNFN